MAVRRVEVGRVEWDDSLLVVQVAWWRETLCKKVFCSFVRVELCEVGTAWKCASGGSSEAERIRNGCRPFQDLNL